MKRHKAQKGAGGVSRANMLIRRSLSWMRGFPNAEGQWIALPARDPMRTMQVNRTDLRKATYALNKLRRDFPRALPKLVGEVDPWLERHRSLLETLKASVHGGAPVSQSAALDLAHHRASTQRAVGATAREFPALGPAIRNFVWAHWLDPDSLLPAIHWLRGHHQEASQILSNLGEVEGCVALLRLWELSKSLGKTRTGAALCWLADPLHFTVPAVGFSYANAVLGAMHQEDFSALESAPKARLGGECVQWIFWLSEQDDATAGRSLDLFNLLAASPAMKAWASWWRELVPLVTKVRDLPYPEHRRDPSCKKAEKYRTTLNSLAASTPYAIPAGRFFLLLRQEADKDRQTHYRAIRRGLKSLPITMDDVPIRLLFSRHWSRLHQDADSTKHKKLCLLIEHFSRFLGEQDDPALALQPWREMWQAQRRGSQDYAHYGVDSALIDDAPRNRDLAIFFRALALVQGSADFDGITEGLAETLCDCVWATKSAEAAACTLVEMQREGLVEEYLPESHLKLAAAICEDEISSIAKIAKALLAAYEGAADLEKATKRLILLWSAVPPEYLRRALQQQEVKVLRASVTKCELIRQAGATAPRPRLIELEHKQPRWIRRFPKELKGALKRLRLCDERSEATAARILGKDFPDPNQLREEIAKMKQRAAKDKATPAIHARIRKLESWLKPQRDPGPVRLANLSRKLEQAATRALVVNWSARVEEEFLRQVPKVLGSESIPSWANDLGVLEMLMSTSGLTSAFQRLVGDLLECRSGEPPWDLRERPGNKSFLAKMKKRGVHMAPWIDEAPVVRREVDNDSFTLRMERDPLEIFMMGAHFKTCLSPGSFNFFSVFANVADINKQVLYGRRGDGGVVARCLLALTKEGHILAFHPYCHTQGIDFKELVKEYVETLAHDMNTKMVAGGSVPLLVAPDWYDDGPVDITNHYETLKKKSFHKELAAVPLSGLLELLQKAIAPLELDELTLPTILWLGAFDERPELVRPLFPIAMNNERLPPPALLRLAELLTRCDGHGEVRHLSARILKYAMDSHRNHHDYVVMHCMEVLLHSSPALTLGLLKKTRRKTNRSWQRETSGFRLFVGGMANLGLHRPRQAKALLEAGVKIYCCNFHRDACRAGLERLGD